MSQLELPDLLTCSCSVSNNVSNSASDQKLGDSVDLLVDGSQTYASYNNTGTESSTASSTESSTAAMWTNVGIVVSAFLLYKLVRNWR